MLNYTRYIDEDEISDTGMSAFFPNDVEMGTKFRDTLTELRQLDLYHDAIAIKQRDNFYEDLMDELMLELSKRIHEFEVLYQRRPKTLFIGGNTSTSTKMGARMT